MSPTPVTTSLPTQPASYSWEATDEEVSARYGIPIDRVLRFDLNTSPAPPDIAGSVLAAGTFESPLSEYPPSDYRRLVETAARVYGVGTDELLVGAGADEILDLCAKAFLARGRPCRRPRPDLRDVPRRDRAAGRGRRERRAPRPRRGLRDWTSPATRAAAAARRDRLALQPEQPHRPAGAAAARSPAPRGHRGRRRGRRSVARHGRPRRGLRRVRSDTLLELRREHPAPGRRPDREQGLRARGPAGRVRHRPARDDRADRAVPAAGLRVDGVRLDRDRGPGRPAMAWPRTSPASTPSASGWRASSATPAGTSDRR